MELVNGCPPCQFISSELVQFYGGWAGAWPATEQMFHSEQAFTFCVDDLYSARADFSHTHI